jgi:ubiquinone/menaquinone biosynthesis C-methylase UbiE
MRRAVGAREHLDGRVAPADLAATLGDLDRLNAWFGGHALSLARVRRVARALPRERTLCVLDVGGGDGAFARRVARWARRAGRAVRVIVLDADETTARLAAAACVDYPEIAVLTADARALPLGAGWADVVHAGLTLHHLEPDAAVPALRDMRRVCRGRLVVNDLTRTPLTLGLVWLVTRLLPVHWMSRHDGPMSVRRAYAPRELGDLFGAAGVTPATVTRYPWLGRLIVDAPDGRGAYQ